MPAPEPASARALALDAPHARATQRSLGQPGREARSPADCRHFHCHNHRYATGGFFSGGFYREVRIPNLCGDLPFGDALGPDLPPPRPGPTTHPVPARRGPHPGRRDRPAARPPPVHRLPRTRPEPLPRRRPGFLRLLPAERAGPGATAPAAAAQAGRRRGLARARHRAPEGRLVAATNSRQAQAAGGRRGVGLPRDHLPPRLRPEGRRDDLYRHLPEARRRRGSRYGRRPRGTPIPRERWIENRPTEIGTRETFGHWEADLLIFGKQAGKANVTSLMERKSRFTFLLANEDKRSTAVVAGIADAFRGLPEDARRAVTFDRGTEFAGYATLDRDLTVKAYFCDPHSPWQKGAVENLNGRVRRFLPRHREPEALAQAHLRRLADRLNDTPRRCLGYRTPKEVFEQHLAAQAGPP